MIIQDNLGGTQNFDGGYADLVKALTDTLSQSTQNSVAQDKRLQDIQETLQKQIDLGQKRTAVIEKVIKDLPKGITNSLKKDFTEFSTILKEIRSVLKETQGRKTKQDEVNTIKAIGKMSDNIAELTKHALSKGSLYMHDENAIRRLDKLNDREAKIEKELSKLKGAIERNPSSIKLKESIDKLTAERQKISIKSGSLSRGMREDAATGGYGKTASAAFDLVSKLKSSSPYVDDIGRKFQYISSYSKDILLNSDMSNKEYVKTQKSLKSISKSSEGIDSFSLSAKKQMVVLSEKLAHAVKDYKSAAMYGENMDVAASKLRQSYAEVAREMSIISKRQEAVQQGTESLKDSALHYAKAMAGTAVAYKGLSYFTEPIKKGMELARQQQRVALDDAYMRLGDMNKQFDQMLGFLDMSSEEMSAMGGNLEAFTKELSSGIKQGVKNMYEFKNVTRTSLNLAYLIGSNAEETASVFTEWHMKIGVGAENMRVLSRTAKEAGMRTGVMGDHLLKAVKNAKELAMEMARVGLASTEASKSFIELSAAAEREGIGKEMNELMGAVSQGFKGWEKASSGMKWFVAQAGIYDKVISGKAYATPKDREATNRAMEKTGLQTLNSFLGTRAKNVKDFMQEYEKLQSTDVGRAKISAASRNLSAMGLPEVNDMVKSINVLNEHNKTSEQKLIEINEQLKMGNLTANEQKDLQDKANQLLKTKETEDLNKNLNKLVDIQKLSKDKRAGIGDLGKFKSGDVEKTLRESIDAINKKLGESGKDQLNSAKLIARATSGSSIELREVIEEIQKASELAEAGKKTQMSRAELDRLNMEQLEREAYSTSILFYKKMSHWPGWTGILVHLAGLVGGTIIANRHLIKIKKDLTHLTTAATHGHSLHTHDYTACQILLQIKNLLMRNRRTNPRGGPKSDRRSSGRGGATNARQRRGERARMSTSKRGQSSGMRGMMGKMGGAVGKAGVVGLALGSVIGLIGVVAEFSPRLQKALENLMKVFTPFLELIGDYFAEIIEDILPDLTQIAKDLMPSFKDTMKEMAKIYKSLMKDVGLPLFVTLLKVWAALMKVWIPILKLLIIPLKVIAPIIEKIGNVFGWLGDKIEKVAKFIEEKIEWLQRQIDKFNPASEAKPAERDWLDRRANNLNPFNAGTGQGVLTSDFWNKKSDKGTWSNIKEGNIGGTLKSLVFDTGGTVPGSPGIKMPATVHGAEEVLNIKQQGMIHKAFGVINDLFSNIATAAPSTNYDMNKRVEQRMVNGSESEGVKEYINILTQIKEGIEENNLINRQIAQNTKEDRTQMVSTVPNVAGSTVIPRFYNWAFAKYGFSAEKSYIPGSSY